MSENDNCYYCYEEASTENPFAITPSPCLCRGSICIHRSCLQQILARTNKCGICKTPYNEFYSQHVNADGSIEKVKNGSRSRYFLNDAGQYHGVFRTYHKNTDIVWEEKTYSNGVLHGTYTIYSLAGQIKRSMFYENGKKEGLDLSYHDNGVLASEKKYRNGIQCGSEKHWFLNGQLLEEKNYENGSLNGPHKKWNDDGIPYFETNYILGKQSGTSIEWYDSGQMRFRKQYINDRCNGLVEKWHDSGVLKERYTMIDDKFHGLYEEWYSNGQLRMSCAFNMNVPYGAYEKYYNHGVLASKGNVDGLLLYTYWGECQIINFINASHIDPAIRIGLWIENYQNGVQKKAENYVNGKLHGLHQIFHKNGMLKEQVMYVNGRKDGAFEKWYADGKVEILSYYENGCLVDKSLNYDRKGSIRIQCA